MLRFEEVYLILLGATFFWGVLILVEAAERRQGQTLWSLVLAVFLAGLAFEGALLGYQYHGFDGLCWLCLGVGGWLLLSGAVLAWRRGSVLIILLSLCVGLAGAAAPNLLRFDTQSVELEKTAFLEREPTQNGPSPELYLFFSLHCSHCSEVFVNLALNRPWSAHWHFCSIDSGEEDLARLAKAYQSADNADNVFVELLRIKQAGDGNPGWPVPEKLRRSTRQAAVFFRSRGYSGIPLLIAREGPGREVALVGTEAIAKYLWERGLISDWLSGREIEERFRQQKP